MSIRMAAAIFLALSSMTTAWASDLGTAGPFRWIGGKSCVTAPGICAPAAIDAKLPLPQQAKAYVARALLLLDVLRLDEARDALNQAMLLDATDPRTRLLSSRLAMMNADLATARADADRGLLLTPNDPDLLATWAFLHRSSAELERSLKAATTALTIKPDDGDALWIRAILFMDLRCYSAAFEDATAALSLETSDKRARLTRARAQLQMHRYEDAAFDAAFVLKASPNDTEALLLMAKAKAGGGDDEGAITTLTQVFAEPSRAASLRMPLLRDAALDRVRLLAKVGRADEAANGLAAILDQGTQPAVLRMQLYLKSNGFPNLEITGQRSVETETALKACFADKVCGPHLTL